MSNKIENILDSFIHLGYVFSEEKLLRRRASMLKIRLIQYLILLSVLLPSLVLSQTQEIKDYKVMKGDTLWDISGKELTDPFLWPKVWKENPEIKNPDRIYPDQTIKIPLYLIQQKEEPQKQVEPVAEPVVIPEPPKEVVKKTEPEKKRSLVDKGLLIASGYIADSVPGVGKVLGSPSGKNLFGNNDLVYVKTNASVKLGDKFYVIRAGKMVNHPVNNKKIGYVVEIVGIAVISKFEFEEPIARITNSFGEITTGDLLDTFYEVEPPAAIKYPRKPNIDGYIVATKNLRLINGTFDIVYIDKGKKDGIEVGDLLRTVGISESQIYKEKHKVPIGIIQIINSKDNTATAIVRESSDQITIGNLITYTK